MHGLRAARDRAWPTAGRVRDPWPGLNEPRINPHWSKPMPEGEPAAQLLASSGSRPVENTVPVRQD